ncbi:MAG TPA: sugar phosphate isomerase/epimerase [Anaerovoracaceae bacterium]|nr:sugar phosphate isomerase/epimerase [Anaerovoracaceae bacterium]
MDIKDRLYVATMAHDAAQIAEKYGIGLEIDEFCTASNMEGEDFDSIDRTIREKMASACRLILHAPFNELFPSAIDPMALRLAYQRYNQAYSLAKQYDISRMVVHSGYVPYVYFKSWFLERSVEFWKTFISDKPENFHIMIENVLEDEPYTLAELIEGIGDKRVKACLDIGHANCSTALDLTEWVKTLGPCLSHVHLHNNRKTYDKHDPLSRGDIDMNLILNSLKKHAPIGVTYTIENLECADSMKWLYENGWIS